jgi:hypothetical protein
MSIHNCKLAVRCDKQWADMSPTDSENIRHCATCKRDVVLCTNRKEFQEAVRLDQCVALDVLVPVDAESSFRITMEPLPRILGVPYGTMPKKRVPDDKDQGD